MQKDKAAHKPAGSRGSSGSDTDPSALRTPSDLSDSGRAKVAEAVNGLVADAHVLYVKTKNFHWHLSGPNFRDYHLLLDEHAHQILASLDPLAERVRKLGQPTLRSLAHILKLASLKENDAEFVSPYDMLNELCQDNVAMAKAMRAAHKVCDEADDIATASLIENYIDETEKRIWFLFESARNADRGGH